MEYTVTYPRGGANKMHEPMHVDVKLGVATNMKIHGLTCTRDGCEIILFDEDGQIIGNRFYSYHQDLGYQRQMAIDATGDMNIMLELNGIPLIIERHEFYDLMNEVRNKCESRYGNRLPDSDYEVLISFS